MINLFYKKNRKIFLPENFDELSVRQFIALAEILCTTADEIILKVNALRILSGLSVFRWRLLPAAAVEKSLSYTDWVFDQMIITKQLLPVYKGHWGPVHDFDNLKMKEFHLSELHYRDLVGSDSKDALNLLVAVLYRKPRKWYNRKKDPEGDIRLPFNHNELEYRASKIAKWPLPVKQAIFLWYDSCRERLIDDNPLVFKEPVKHSFESQFDTGLYGMIRSLAGEKLGPVEKIEEMYVHTAMLELGLIREEEKYLDEQLKSKPQ